MAETTPNPFENTNSGPSAPAPDAPAVDTACCAAAKTPCVTSRVLLYGPVALLFVGIVALWTVPGLAAYAAPILSLIDPTFNKSDDEPSCCSSTLEKTGSCCAIPSKAAMMTSSASSEEISLDSGADIDDGLCPCCDDEDGLCPTKQAATAKASADESDE